MSSFFEMVFGGIRTGSYIALAALGIILIFRTSLTTNFAQGTIGMFNAVVAAYFFDDLGFGVPISLLLGILSAFIMGIIIDLVVMRRAKQIDVVGKQIITMGLIMILSGLKTMIPIFGTENKQFGRLISSKHVVKILGVNFYYNDILNIGIVILILIILFFILQKSKWGLGVRVTASNEYTARLMGVPTKTITMAIWAVAAALSALAALMLAPNDYVNSHMMVSVQVNAFLALVLGGFSTYYGAVVGAYLIAISANLFKFYLSDTWGEPLVYLFILIFLLFKPYGIFGKKIVKKV